MNVLQVAHASPSRARRGGAEAMLPDGWVLGIALILLTLGLVMVASASIGIADRQFGNPMHYFTRQGVFAALGLALGFALWRVPLVVWERSGRGLILLSVAVLGALLIPGIGHTVNGSVRWIALGPFNVQPSEAVKLFALIYLAGYLVRRREVVRSTLGGFLRPMGLLAVLVVLLLLEPDFGAAAVLLATALGMMWLGGVPFWHFGGVLSLVMAVLGLVAWTSPYRLERLTTFLNPWSDPFNSGFQLTQALIAFGRGEWLGAGLGASVQKLFYLPEAHTDFMFAVLAEELGLLGALAVIALFALLVARAFAIGRRAERVGRPFAAYLSYGIALWIGLQAFINLGVNMGVLPTKGLTLPLMSYGGSSMLVMCMSIGLLLRADLETRRAAGEGGAR